MRAGLRTQVTFGAMHVVHVFDLMMLQKIGLLCRLVLISPGVEQSLPAILVRPSLSIS